MPYDPAVGPEPAVWLGLDDGERVVVVREYHKRAKERADNPELHAIIHATVETQLAEGDPAVKAGFDRLSEQGLDRHNVVHAIGSVLADAIYGVMKTERAHDPLEYARKLSELTAEGWLHGLEE
jgi:hypothetical protein